MARVYVLAALVAAMVVVVVVVVSVALRAQQRDGIPDDVLEMGDGLRMDFVESNLDVRELVAKHNAEPWIARMIRSSPRAAISWQIAPEVVSSLEDDEIVDFVLTRAQHVAVCTFVLWNTVLLRELQEMEEPSEAMQSFMRASVTPEMEERELTYRVGPTDCIELVDRAGDTAVIRSRGEIEDVFAYERAFATSEVMRSRSAELIRSQVYDENAAYVESEFAGPITIDRGFANSFRTAVPDWPGDGRAFRLTMNNLMLYLVTELPESEGVQLVFVAPFVW